MCDDGSGGEGLREDVGVELGGEDDPRDEEAHEDIEFSGNRGEWVYGCWATDELPPPSTSALSDGIVTS